MTDQIARLDGLAGEIRAKTNQGTATRLITELATALGDQTTAEFPDIDPAAIGAVLMDAAIRLQVMVTHTDYRMTSQAVVSVLAAAGEQLYTKRAAR